MKRERAKLSKWIAAAIAVGMIAAGLLLGWHGAPASPDPSGASSAMPAASSGVPSPSPQMPAAAEPPDAARGQPPALESPDGDAVAEEPQAGSSPRAVHAPRKAAEPKRVSRPARKKQPAPEPPQRPSLPPFQLVGQADNGGLQPVSGPPPGVLWLSGVIQGERQVAILRRGENRYLVKDGDTFEDRYRVIAISSNSVTVRRGSRKQTLRVGQY